MWCAKEARARPSSGPALWALQKLRSVVAEVRIRSVDRACESVSGVTSDGLHLFWPELWCLDHRKSEQHHLVAKGRVAAFASSTTRNIAGDAIGLGDLRRGAGRQTVPPPTPLHTGTAAGGLRGAVSVQRKDPRRKSPTRAQRKQPGWSGTRSAGSETCCHECQRANSHQHAVHHERGERAAPDEDQE